MHLFFSTPLKPITSKEEAVRRVKAIMKRKEAAEICDVPVTDEPLRELPSHLRDRGL